MKPLFNDLQMVSPSQKQNSVIKQEMHKVDSKQLEVNEENFDLIEEEKGFDELPDFSQL